MKKATVADISPRMAELEEKRKLVRTIMGGTEAMRAAKESYLPKHPAESDGVYQTRLQKTFLDNFVGLAIDKSVGKIFAKPIVVADISPQVETLADDIDRQGRDLDSFMMDVAKLAFQDGISYVLADKPPMQEGATVADAKAAGVRPYSIHLRPSCILEPRHQMVNGVEKLTLLRWMECVTERNGEWGSVEIQQVRVLRLEDAEGNLLPTVRWEIHREDEKDKEWKIWQQGNTSFPSIYLVPFYTNRCGFLEGLPGFQGIAEKNLEHWQWKGEHAHALSMCCFSMYTATGVEEDFTFTVGPAKAQTSTSPDAKFGVLETTGKGVELAAEAIKAIESRIETAGVHLRVEAAGKVTATAAAIDSADTDSGLKAVAEGFGDSTLQLLAYFAEMMSEDIGKASVKYNTDFGRSHGTDAGLTSLDKARALGDISREGYIEVLKWRGEIPAEFDTEEDKRKLDEEGPALGTMGTQGADNANS